MSIFTESGSSLMPSEGGNDPTLLSIEAEWYRLIPSRFPPVSIYERIIANDRVPELVEIENLTNPRLRKARSLTDGVELIGPGSPLLQNWNLASFTYPRPDGTRYFRPIFSCLELADELQTALAISVAKRGWFLEQTGEPPQGIDMRVLKTPVKGKFLDLRHFPIALSTEDRWNLGDKAVQRGCDGVLFNPLERPSATCIGIVRETALERSQQTKHFRFYWNGKRISSLYAFDDAKEIEPDQLSSPELLIAA